MTDGVKLRSRLPNGAELEVEGPEKTVREFYETFLKGYREPASPPPAKAKQEGKDAGLASNTLGGDSPGTVPADVLNRLFVLSKDGRVTLRALPTTDTREADSLIALIYGYMALKDEHSVSGLELKQAAHQSGVQIDRVDRVLSPYETWVTAAGRKRGRKYGLNNQGVRKAEGVLTQIMG
jgi:hypothetical protein